MDDVFKSPEKKLIQFFKKSRNSWKEKAKQSTQEIRGFKKRISFLESSKQVLKEKNKQLQMQLAALNKALEEKKQ